MNSDWINRRMGSPSQARTVSYEALLKRCVDHGLHRDPTTESLLRFLEHDNKDRSLIELVTERLAEADRIQLLTPEPFVATNPITSGDLPGSIGLGLIQPDGVPWCITPEMLTTHVLLTARSGGGKSNQVFLILGQLLELRRYDQAV